MKSSMPVLGRRLSGSGQSTLKSMDDAENTRLSRKASGGILENRRLSLKEVSRLLLTAEGKLASSGILINDPQFK